MFQVKRKLSQQENYNKRVLFRGNLSNFGCNFKNTSGMQEPMLRVRHSRDIFLKVFKCLRKMHANTLCGIFAISETYLPLISKTASEPTRHLFTSFDTFQNTKTQNYFPHLFQQEREENQGFSEPHSEVSAVTPALLSKQASAAATRRGHSM